MSGRGPLGTPPGTSDPGHLLPDAEWQQVVEDAAREASRILAGEPAPEAPEVRGFATGLLALSGVVSARAHGGRRPGGAPTFGVLHSAETPLRAGYAASIARYIAAAPNKSCHYMTDPAETWGVLDDALIAWHVGTANTNSLGLEQAGYARFSRAEWLTPEGWAQMRRNAAIMRAARDRYGIGLYWMTDAQLLAAHRRQIVGGWATHDQCREVLGGTTHTDPMPNFPLAEQMQLANDPTGDPDVLTTGQAQQLDNIHAVLFQGSTQTPVQLTVYRRLVDVQNALTNSLPVLLAAAQREAIDPAELTAAIVGAIVPAVVAELTEVDGTFTPDELEAATERALRRVLGGLDAPGPLSASAVRLDVPAELEQ